MTYRLRRFKNISENSWLNPVTEPSINKTLKKISYYRYTAYIYANDVVMAQALILFEIYCSIRFPKISFGIKLLLAINDVFVDERYNLFAATVQNTYPGNALSQLNTLFVSSDMRSFFHCRIKIFKNAGNKTFFSIEITWNIPIA